MLTRLVAFVRGVWRRRRAEGEAGEELAFHLQQEIDANVARGLSPDEARRIALAALGGLTQVSEAVRGVRMTSLDGLWRDVRLAWRGVRSRRTRAILVVALVAVTLAANAMTFSVVDSLVFNPYPYVDANRLVVVRAKVTAPERVGQPQTAALHAEWRKQRDIVEAVGGFLPKTLFVTHDGVTEIVPAADVTVDMFQVLGVRPRWGRAFTDADLADSNSYAAIISESLARQYFGRPERALGKRLDATGGGPLLVVGVVASDFAFPSAAVRAWRALDLSGPLTQNFGAVSLVVRPAPDVSTAAVAARLAARAPSVGRAAGLSTYAVQVVPYFKPAAPDPHRAMLFVLLGAALSLLTATCVNVASLELAYATQRGPTRTLLLALGASRAALVRTVVIEAAMLIGAALTLAWGLAVLGLRVIVDWLPRSIVVGTQHPLRVDPRVFWFMSAAAAGTWLAAFVLPAVATERRRPESLAMTSRSASPGRANTRLRQILTALEVALAVGLLVTGVFYVRSYRDLSRVDKGFNSDGLAELRAPTPANYFPTPADRHAFVDRLADALRSTPGVLGVTPAFAPPSTGDSPMQTVLEIDGTRMPAPISLGENWVDPSYFPVIGLPLKAGRYLQPGDTGTSVVAGEAFARRFWPNGDAVGHSFRGTEEGFFSQPMTVVGVVGDVRTDARSLPTTDDARYFIFGMAPALASAVAYVPPQIDNGGHYGIVSLTIRLDSRTRAPVIRAVAARLNPQLPFDVRFVDDLYDAMNADSRLATEVVNAYSALGLIIAIAGLYGVMTFLVASRTREIGIRLALGADQRDVGRLVLSSGLRLAGIGAIAGSVGAYLIARSIQSQLFGVSALDVWTYVFVLGVVLTFALLAISYPAWQASRIDPATTLRGE